MHLPKFLRSVIKTPEIEFLCTEEDFGVIPEPIPSRKVMPDWYKALPQRIDEKQQLKNSTIKRCAPFLDALTVGWIIPLAADVDFTTNDNASQVTYKSNFYKPMVENHSTPQITSSKCPHPSAQKPPMKFLNYWMIKVPEDYSILFVPPLNRPDPRFQCLSGMVDCDGYFEYVNFPFQFHERNFTGIIKQGTPLVQLIPIKRETLFRDHTARTFTEDEISEHNKTKRKVAAHESHYRDSVWTTK